MFASAILLALAVASPPDSSDPSKALIEGVVVDEAGKPVGGITISTRQWQHGPAVATTNQEGQFRLVLDSAFAGFRIIYAASADGLRRGRCVTPFLNWDPVVTARITLKPAVDVRVSVFDAKGMPVAGATVAMNDEGIGLLAHATTNRHGEGSMSVPADSKVHVVAAFKSAVGFDYFENYAAWPPPEPMPIPREVRLVLNGARTVRARVTDGEGKPLPDVSFYPILMGKRGKIAIASSMGFVALIEGAMPKSSAEGIATCDWFPPELTRAVPLEPQLPGWHCAATPYFDMSTGSEPQPCQMVRELRCGGRVTKPDGNPAPGIVVQAEGRGNTNIYCRAYARTRADGRYEFDLFPEQGYIVTVIDSIYIAPSLTGIVLRDGKPRTDLNLTLIQGVLVEGKVTAGPKNEAAAEQTVYLKQEGTPLPEELGKEVAGRKPELVRRAQTDSSGRYHLRLSPGSYQIAGPDMKFVDLDVSASDEKVVRDFQLIRLPRGPFTVTVAKPDGTPAAGAIIESVKMGDARTDERGVVRAMRAREPMLLYARDASGALAACAAVGADDDSATLTLRPAATAQGRVVGNDSKPCLNYTITCIMQMGDDKTWARTSTYSGVGGLFSLPGIPLGVSCRLQICDAMRCGVKPAKEFTVNSPGPLDLGDVSMPKDEK